MYDLTISYTTAGTVDLVYCSVINLEGFYVIYKPKDKKEFGSEVLLDVIKYDTGDVYHKEVSLFGNDILVIKKKMIKYIRDSFTS